MRNIFYFALHGFNALRFAFALFIFLPNLCQSQEPEYFKCPRYEVPNPQETPVEANCQTCETNPNHPNFNCLSATIIGYGSAFPKSSDIGPSISGDVCMVGNFTVDDPFVFQDAVVRICKGAEIFVNMQSPFFDPESGLVIDHSELFSCTGMWKGIRVTNNSTITTRNNSKIEDAEIAIGTIFPISHLYIENTIFNRNRIGINIKECVDQNQAPCPFAIPTGIIWTFRGNQFTCSAPLKGTTNEYGFAGVILRNTDIIDFPNSVFSRFSDLDYGILGVGRCDIGATKMIFHRIKHDGISLETGSLRLYDSHFFNCEDRGITIARGLIVDLKDLSFVLSGNSLGGISIGTTGLNAPITCNNIIVHGTAAGITQKTGISISGVAEGTKIRIDGSSTFNIYGNYSTGISLNGPLAPSTTTEIWGNHFRTSAVGDLLFNGTPRATGINTSGNINNLSIKSNSFTAHGPPFYPFYVSKDRGITLGTNITGINNEISVNDFNDEVLTLHDAIYVDGFQNMKYCSNTLSGAREEAHGFNFNGTCVGTDIKDNIMTFGESPNPDHPCVALLIQSNTQIGAQENKGNEWHNLLGLEPSHHAQCLAVPTFNKFLVHTPQSTCADENNPNCFFKYHPRKVSPDSDNQFFDIDPVGSPVEGCSEGSGTDELDRNIAQGLFEPPIDNPAMSWVLDRYLYQKFKDNPGLISDHTSFPSFMFTKVTGTVGKFYEISKSTQNGLSPSENVNTQSKQALVDVGLLMEFIKTVDEQLETAVNSSEIELLYQTKKGLLTQIEALNLLYDSLTSVYQSQLAVNLQPAYALNQSISTAHLYEVSEKIVNQIYLLSLMQQGGELTESQVLALQTIAQQDPKLAGPAVHTALGMLSECAKPEIPQAYSLLNGEHVKQSSESTDRTKQLLTVLTDRKVTVAPNPAESTFKVSGLWNGNGILSLLDLQGRIILNKVFTGNEIVAELPLNTPSGIYLIRIAMDNGSIYVEKLVVNPK